MDAKKELTIEEKLALIRSRAVRFKIKRHDLEDAVQEVALYLLTFESDPATANGASESTILTGAIDLRLKQWLRTKQRYQDMVERCGAMLPSDDELLCESSVEASDTALDVATVLADLPEFERQVGQMLSQGHNATSIARELGVKRPVVCEAMTAIRERFISAGLGGVELA
jgi:DNA-directed RNA polymerase specialized sigma24 family protein